MQLADELRAASGYRAPGSLASARAKIGSNARGRSRFAAEIGGTGAWTCAAASAAGVSASNGRRPVNSSQATTARP